MNPVRSFILLILPILALTACNEKPAAANPEGPIEARRPLVVASNYPLYFFAGEIAGDSAEVVLPAMEGDPADWKPGSEAIALLQSADLIVLNGAGYESWLGWVTLPEERLLDSTEGFSDSLLPLRKETVHQHGPGGEHSHKGVAFTVWLDPGLAAKQAAAVEQAISRLVPENAERHRGNLARLTGRLESLDAALSEAFGTLGKQPLVFSHPVYQYLEARYRLNGASLHWEPGTAPGTRDLIDLGNILRDHPAKLVIWEDGPLAATVETLQQQGLQSRVFNTASNHPGSGDYFEVMEANIARLLLK